MSHLVVLPNCERGIDHGREIGLLVLVAPIGSDDEVQGGGSLCGMLAWRKSYLRRILGSFSPAKRGDLSWISRTISGLIQTQGRPDLVGKDDTTDPASAGHLLSAAQCCSGLDWVCPHALRPSAGPAWQQAGRGCSLCRWSAGSQSPPQ